MPRRDDDALVDQDLPSMSAENRQSSASDVYQARKRGLSTPVNLFLLFLILVAGILASGWFYQQLQQRDHELQVANERITKLERSLLSTDESMSQSSVAMQLRLKELTERTDKLWDQMDKLWASAWRRNQKEIGTLVKDMTAIKTDFNEVGKNIGVLSRRTKNQQKKLDEGFESIDAKLASLSKTSSQLQALLDEANARSKENKSAVTQTNRSLDNLRSSVDVQPLKDRIRSNEDWVKAINTHRKQLNTQIKQLQDAVRDISKNTKTSFNPVYPGMGAQPGVQ